MHLLSYDTIHAAAAPDVDAAIPVQPGNAFTRRLTQYAGQQ
jgi:hypothetical protein